MTIYLRLFTGGGRGPSRTRWTRARNISEVGNFKIRNNVIFTDFAALAESLALVIDDQASMQIRRSPRIGA